MSEDYFTFKNAVPFVVDYEPLIFDLCQKENMGALLCLISFLDYSEVIHLKQSKKTFAEAIDKKLIKQYALLGLVTNTSRSLYYQSIINSHEMTKLLSIELIEYNIKDNLYSQLLGFAQNKMQSNNITFKKICDEIQRDLPRTFYSEKFVNGNGKEMLNNVLIALAFIRPEIGYCQGMNFIAGALINFLDNEKFVFWVFLAFIDNIELNLLYLKNMPDYSIRVYQLNYYIRKFLPKLFNHFKKNQINPDIFFSKWILAIFSSFLNMDVLAKVWDVFIIDKWKAIFKFSLSLLTIMYNDLITMDINGLSKYFRINTNSKAIFFNDLSQYYNQFKITNKEIAQLRGEFFINQVQNKLDDPQCRWDTDQNEFVDQFKINLESHLKESKKQMIFFQEKIEKINREYEHAQSTYEAQLEVCCNLKLQVEVLIEMKSGYENVLVHLKNGEKNHKTEKKKILSINFLSPDSRTDSNKIQKKLKQANKDLDHYNKLMFENYEVLDEKKYNFEQIKKEKDNYKESLASILIETEKGKKELIKNLSQKLKLSAKFVSTSKY